MPASRFARSATITPRGCCPSPTATTPATGATTRPRSSTSPWILVAAQLPEHMRFYMEMKQQQLDDPATVELYRDLAVAIHWEADDPRVAAVADRLVGLLESAEAQGWETQDKEMTDELAELLDSVFLDSLPIARQLMDLLEAQGWRGWTKLERIGTAQT